MGWTSYYIDKDQNTKQEVDRILTWSDSETTSKVIKSVMKGSVYYGAIEQTTNENKTIIAVVCLTSRKTIDGANFAYKLMTESEGPVQSKCPESILKLLPPTTDKFSLGWRKRCQENNKLEAKHRKLAELPVGTEIKAIVSGQPMKLKKRSPGYQFKKTYWVYEEGNYYISKSNISEYEIITND